jgi:hypothetical protein
MLKRLGELLLASFEHTMGQTGLALKVLTSFEHTMGQTGLALAER